MVAMPCQVGGGRLAPHEIAAGDHHAGAGGRQPGCHGLTDSCCSACNHGDLAGKRILHGDLLIEKKQARFDSNDQAKHDFGLTLIVAQASEPSKHVIRSSVPRVQETKGQVQDCAPDEKDQIQAASTANRGQSPIRGKSLDHLLSHSQRGQLFGRDAETDRERSYPPSPTSTSVRSTALLASFCPLDRWRVKWQAWESA